MVNITNNHTKFLMVTFLQIPTSFMVQSLSNPNAFSRHQQPKWETQVALGCHHIDPILLCRYDRRYSLFILEVVRRQCAEPSVFNWAAHREVVETLPLA